jgi:hypothetical protein
LIKTNKIATLKHQYFYSAFTFDSHMAIKKVKSPMEAAKCYLINLA